MPLLHPGDVEPPERCVRRAERRGDDMLGSAFAQPRLLLVEQPGPWGPSGLTDSHFDRSVAAQLAERADRADVRLLAIRHHGRTATGQHRRWCVVDTVARTARWGTYEADAELLDLPLDGSVGSPDPELLYLVCAHSRRDTCCAVRGRAVAAALQELRPGVVWECSHTGGHRFAANVLVLPSGLLYGRVLPESVSELVDATERGDVITGLLRGHVGHTPAEQAAIAHVHAEYGLLGLDDVRLVSSEQIRDGVVDVELDTPTGNVRVEVLLETIAVEDGLSCGKVWPESYLAARPVSLSRDS